MRQSHLFTKTKRENPTEEVSRNAQLLLRGGYIYKEMAGVYAYLPLGLRVIKKIEQIIREEMNAIGGQEVTLTALQEKETWEKTNRWSDEVVDVWFKTALKNDTAVGLGFTHEEPLTKLMKEFIASYRDLPKSVYQFQTKFRNETRAKSGIMRTREFVMKDLYSFSKNKAEHDEFYERVKQAYATIFNRIGIGEKTFLTFASGGAFSQYSHEFQTVTEAGEDIIYVDQEKGIAVNKEVFTDEVIGNLGLEKEKLVEQKAVEVGNIFTLGTRFSEAFDLSFIDEGGEKQPVFMGSYGIGPGRLIGTIVETLSDEKGIVWPQAVAPFDVHLIQMRDTEPVKKEAERLYTLLQKQGISVLFDDRVETSAGEKLTDADLLGMPLRVVVSERSLEKGGVELKKRTEETVSIGTEKEIIGIVLS